MYHFYVVIENDSCKLLLPKNLKAKWIAACLEMSVTNAKFKEEAQDLTEQLDVLSMSQGNAWWEKLKLTKESDVDISKVKKMKAL